MKRYALLIVFCVLSAGGGFAQTKSQEHQFAAMETHQRYMTK